MGENFMKQNILILAFLVLALAGAFAQAASLRRGFYRAQGKTDEILIMPNVVFDIKAEGFRQRNGYYGMSAWSGSVRDNKLMFVATGMISGSEIGFIVDEANAGIIYETTGESTIGVGTLVTYTIVDHETFVDAAGQRWVYHRDSRGF
jgi:hypothetical protein